ncbi:DnaA ATPase domain-containing protein [Aquabacter cavernae]|uniref:DnaA ATPase domain-containing protein n=1 Tax=Aquabacter cavernae TaxID=2496029 RepID=UPI000F8C7F1D|nr:DnaA/Hda family protein [Aquabacter cavernae]
MASRDRAPSQLPLELPSAPGFKREDFLEAPGNAAALALLDAYPDWPAPMVCLVGPAGAGKSHLAAMFAETAGALQVRAGDLTRAGVPEALVAGALVVEDLAAGAFDEAALFHLLNLAKETGAHVLFTARQAPSGFALATADLASRLRAMPTVEIAPADDALLAAVLVKLFADRQIPVDEPTVHYLLARMERSVSGAEALVGAIDRAALAARRPVTRAFAADVLRATSEAADEE